ncbi:MAG: hypothetical protein IPQ07_03340 [Myxococcales bacterium]|nr:hypothetical protein [Myxococcales bacterium]
MSAYRLAGVLRYAAIQFVVLTPIAMVLYAGGTWFDRSTPHYQFTGNFLSDLGMTHAFSGRANYPSCALFAISLATVGTSIVAFGWTWRGFAFERGRARIAGQASAVFATLSGLAFLGVAATPFDRALDAHNTFVLAGFGLLPCYVATITYAMWRNGVGGARIAANLAYLALVMGYVGLVVAGPRLDTPSGHMIQVVGQKTVAYGSMLHVIFLVTTTRRALRDGSLTGERR